MFYETALFNACKSGNIKLVKYLISFNKIDLADTSVILKKNKSFFMKFFKLLKY